MTVTEGIEDAKRCPFCGSNVDLTRLGRLGLSAEELHILTEHAKNKTLKDVLRVAEIEFRRLDPEKMSAEFQVNDAISKLREVPNDSIKTLMTGAADFIEKICQGKEVDKIQIVKEYEQKYRPIIEALQKELVDTTKNIEKLLNTNQIQYLEIYQLAREMKEKIVGTGIGNVSEIVTIRDLKEVVPIDSFSEERSCKGGTDIIGTVKDKGIICGKITISNKCTQKWEGQFMSQLSKDMNYDGSHFGILVTKVFPREALSLKAYVVDTEEGKTVIVVKPEYAPLAYFGLREAVIHWFETRKILKRKEDEFEEIIR